MLCPPGSSNGRTSAFCARGALAYGEEAEYVGSTDNVNRRLAEHNSGRCRYMSGRMPWKLIHLESYGSRAAAMARETFLKSGQGRQWLNQTFEK